MDAATETPAHRQVSGRRTGLARLGRRCRARAGTARTARPIENNAHYASSYGIFGGQADKIAVLRFTKERARWVADEVWHPQQLGRRLEDGSYELRIPYNNPRELVMDVLREGPNLIVIEPAELVDEVKSKLQETLGRYNKDS